MEKINTMIVSKPGSWQRIIINHINKYPSLNISDVLSGSLTAAERLGPNYPDILLIDSSISLEDVVALVIRAKSKNPKTKIIAIADTNHQRERICRSGADFVVSSFSLEAEIDRVYKDLFSEQSEILKDS